jgi:hypothetical protein
MAFESTPAMTRTVRIALAAGLSAALLSPVPGGAAETAETWDKLAACAGAYRASAKAAASPDDKKAAVKTANSYADAATAAYRTERRGSVSAASEAVKAHDAANVRGFGKEKPEDLAAFIAGCPELPAR